MTDLLTDRWFGAVRVRLASPERRNALALDTVRGLRAALESDPAATFVLGSTDPQVFCAGADVKVSAEIRMQISDELYDCYRLMVTRPGAVLAVVEGVAVGGGAQLTTAADLRIGGPAARWRWVGPGHGLVVGGWILPAMVGRGRALELALMSPWLSAEDAVRYGLITDVHPDPWAQAQAAVEQIAGLDPAAVARLKRSSTDGGLVERLDAEQRNNSGWDGRAPGR